MERFDDIVADVGYFDDWEDRYRYIIDLGSRLPLFPDDCRDDLHKVDGCVSRVWLQCRVEGEGSGVRLYFLGDSDAFIVKGLIAILFSLYEGRLASEILAIEAGDAFSRLGLDSHLSPNRRNGFFALESRIKGYAREHGGVAE